MTNRSFKFQCSGIYQSFSAGKGKDTQLPTNIFFIMPDKRFIFLCNHVGQCRKEIIWWFFFFGGGTKARSVMFMGRGSREWEFRLTDSRRENHEFGPFVNV